MEKRRSLFLLVSSAILLCLIALTLWSSPASAYTSDQAARGAQVFKERCAVCHGDVGQGLAKWRLTWPVQDQNCATSKCHGRNHPPEGFYMPVDAPPIIGESTLTDYRTAGDLYAFISKKMPFSEPGVLSADDYWALTAFLIREHGGLPDGVRLDAVTAGFVPINPDSQSPIDLLVIGVALAAVFCLSGLVVWRLIRRVRHT
jgi:mono/diheme cytochrome c family protein